MTIAGLGVLATVIVGAATLVETRISSVKTETKEYVDLKTDAVMVEVKNLKQGQKDIKGLINKLIFRQMDKEK